jgi:replication fork protection complex subunit Csm3/Swi3
VNDFLKDIPLNDDDKNPDSAPQAPPKDIDEEITVKKKRKPIAKLDESRLLSENGITKLRKISKTRLKLRGKGHEFSDMSRLLNMYQLWLDDLYPRAKFRDALVMVEKLGHSKRMQITRKAWLDGTKPYRRDASPERVGDVEMSGALPESQAGKHAPGNESPIFTAADAQTSTGAGIRPSDTPDEDELDALLAEQDSAAPDLSTGKEQRKRIPFEEDSDEDELDALLGEQLADGPEAAVSGRGEAARNTVPDGPFAEDDFADEEEVMASMEGT